jgi:LysM repeat protein/FtsZ-binding cell division protein ZapB
MLKAALLALAGMLIAATATAQVSSPQLGMEVAGLREDVRSLVQRVGELSLRVEQLERENANLRRATTGLDSTYATVAQLNAAVADLNRAIRAGDTAAREQAAAAIKELARQTNAAVDSVAKGAAARATVQTNFSDEFPKEGISYTVQRGDTLSSIASRFGASIKDIQNANKISDPRSIQVGQTLFIPGAK